MPWMPGVTQNPGVNANNHGNLNQNTRLHYTVGTDSTGIGVAGYFHFLIPKEGTPQQFAPSEAICWDACEWNPTGCGIEFERLSADEPLTDNQISWGGQIIRWLSDAHGIPLTFRDSPDDRLPVGTPYAGSITHRSLHEVQCDEHYDYVTVDDWNRMIGPSPQPPTPPVPPTPEELAVLGPFIATYPSKAGPPAVLFMEHPVTGKKTVHWLRQQGDIDAAVLGGAKLSLATQVSDNFVAGYNWVGDNPTK